MREVGDAFVACCSVPSEALMFLTLMYDAVLSVPC